MVIDGNRAHRHDLRQIPLEISVFRSGLRDPLDGSALHPVLVEDALDVPVTSRLPGVDAGGLALAQEFLDVRRSEVVAHLEVNRAGYVPIAADGIAADDQSRDRVIGEQYRREAV